MTVRHFNELTGTITSIRFEGSEGAVGLKEDALNELDKIAELAYKHFAGGTATSKRFISATVVDWLQERYRSETTEPLSAFARTRLESAVRRRTILIPIANLYIDENITFGPVDLKIITPQMLDSMYEAYRSNFPPDEVADFEIRFRRLRSKTQGLAAVVLTVEADKATALEQCLEQAEQATALLRVMHPANSSPHLALYIRPLGSENIESYNAYIYLDQALEGRTEQQRLPFPGPWEIRKADNADGIFPKLASLLATTDRTDFQQRLFDALLVYSRNNVAKEPAEKLIFCLVAVESMLLKDESEPIQDNIGERMAYILGRTPEERLEIESLVKQVYKIRSKFIHHGQRPTDMDTLAQFMDRAWALFFELIYRVEIFATKAEMLDSLKRVKYR